MKLGEKIRYIRKTDKHMKLREFHTKLASMFGKDAISYKSLIRIEKDRRDGRLSSIHQIACGLDMDVKELLAGTEREAAQRQSIFADVVTKKSRPGKFNYNEKAYIEILSSKNSSFMGVELVLEPGSASKEEVDPEGTEVLVIVVKGKITAYVQNEEHALSAGDSIYFKSHLPHYFKNTHQKTAKAILVQNPKSF